MRERINSSHEEHVSWYVPCVCSVYKWGVSPKCAAGVCEVCAHSQQTHGKYTANSQTKLLYNHSVFAMHFDPMISIHLPDFIQYRVACRSVSMVIWFCGLGIGYWIRVWMVCLAQCYLCIDERRNLPNGPYGARSKHRRPHGYNIEHFHLIIQWKSGCCCYWLAIALDAIVNSRTHNARAANISMPHWHLILICH